MRPLLSKGTMPFCRLPGVQLRFGGYFERHAARMAVAPLSLKSTCMT